MFDIVVILNIERCLGGPYSKDTDALELRHIFQIFVDTNLKLNKDRLLVFKTCN